jgi:hypothetical protein
MNPCTNLAASRQEDVAVDCETAPLRVEADTALQRHPDQTPANK